MAWPRAEILQALGAPPTIKIPTLAIARTAASMGRRYDCMIEPTQRDRHVGTVGK
jgi:hypothetical protein